MGNTIAMGTNAIAVDAFLAASPSGLRRFEEKPAPAQPGIATAGSVLRSRRYRTSIHPIPLPSCIG